MPTLPRYVLLILLLVLAACGPLPIGPTATAEPIQETPTGELPAFAATDIPSAPRLTLWIAPSIAPNTETPAGSILMERLDAFAAQNPEIELDIRIKDESGQSGLIDTLRAASIAAPDALPDIVSLDRDALRRATLENLILPLDSIIEPPSSPDWYEHAIAASRIEDSFRGIPIASDADLFTYRTEQYEGPPFTWNEIVEGPSPFLFPAADSTASFTIAQYLALGGQLMDENSNHAIDPAILSDVLSFYTSARVSGVLPFSVLQYADSEETWSFVREDLAASSVAPSKSFFENASDGAVSGIPLPTREGSGICFTDTWSWALAGGGDPEQIILASELLTWLTEPVFLGEWTFAMKALPPTSSALEQWPEGQAAAVTSRLVTTCIPMPTSDILSVFGPPLQEAVEQVINGGTTPEAAALSAAEAIQTP